MLVSKSQKKKYCSLCNSQDIIFSRYIKFNKKINYFFHCFVYLIYKILSLSLIEKLPSKIKKNISWGIWIPNSKIKRCNSCGYGCLDNSPTKNSIKFWYDNAGQTSNLGTKRSERSNSQFNFINQNIDLNKIKSLLDYGCGNYPVLVEMISKQNDSISINVSDISEHTTNLLSNFSYISKAYHVTNPTEINKKFDLIILSHIVNNVLDAFTFITDIYSLLNKNGYLMIEIKNCDLDYYKNCKTNFPFFHFFNDNSFQKVMSKFDLEIIKLKYYGPSNYSFFKGAGKTYEESDNGIFLRYLLKKIN